MKHLALFAAALTLFTTAAFAADATFDKTLSVSTSPTVTIATGAGQIHVVPGSDNQLHIIGHVHSSWLTSDAEVKQIAANPPITISGNTIAIGVHGDSNLFHNVSIDYDVTTPRSTVLTAHSGSGRIEIAGIQSVTSASTGSGSIHIDGAGGGLRANTGSGSIEIAGTPSADWRLSTGSGSIHLTLPEAARFALNASSGAGAIRVERPIVMQGSLNRHSVTGTVNGGGPIIHASTGAGGITIN